MSAVTCRHERDELSLATGNLRGSEGEDPSARSTGRTYPGSDDVMFRLEDTTAAEMMLLPYISDPDTGSRIPSMSTGGAAMKAMMNTEVAVSRVGMDEP